MGQAIYMWIFSWFYRALRAVYAENECPLKQSVGLVTEQP